MEIALGTLNTSTNSGIRRVLNTQEWFYYVQDNTRTLTQNSGKEKLTAIQRYVEGTTTATRRERAVMIRLCYYYLSQTTTNSDFLEPEFVTLYNKVKEYLDTHTGDIGDNSPSAILDHSLTWALTIPNISESRTLRPLILEYHNQRSINIIWWTGKLPSKFLDVYKLAYGVETYENPIENIYIFRKKSTQSTLLLINNPDGRASEKIISKDDLDKILYDTVIGDDKYVQGFALNRIASNPSSSDKDRICELINNSQTDAEINNLIDVDRRIRGYLESYHDALTHRMEAIERLKSIENVVHSADAFVKVLDKMKDSMSWRISNPYLILTVTTPIFNYDEQVIRKMFEKDTFRKSYSALKDREWLVNIFKECFIDNTLEFITTTEIRIHFANRSVERTNRLRDTAGYYTSTQPEEYAKFQSTLPNPHIARFNCWGQNGPVLVDLLTNCKWEEFLYCLKATLGNLNFNDSTVLETLIKWLIHSPDSLHICKDVKTGEMLNITQLKERWKKINEENKDN